jgi:hypothetical protein
MRFELSEKFDGGILEIREKGFRRLWEIYKRGLPFSKFLDEHHERLDVKDRLGWVIVDFYLYGNVIKKATGIEAKYKRKMRFDDYAIKLYNTGAIRLLGVYNDDDYTEISDTIWIQEFFQPKYSIKDRK